jgi:Mg2+-importing ATPase
MFWQELALLESDEVLKKFKVNKFQGLSDSEINNRRNKFGRNELRDDNSRVWTILRRQFASPFVYLLAGAGSLSVFMGEAIEGLMIFLFVAINAALGFYQEYKSEKIVKSLKSYVVFEIKAIRGGAETILPVADLVPGDIILLETGDLIPADVVFVETKNLVVDESLLSGESISVDKRAGRLTESPSGIFQAANCGFSGTAVVGGNAKAVVISTGKSSEVGKIAKLAAGTKKESIFEKDLSKFSSFILRMIAATIFLIIAANILIKGVHADFFQLILFSIALAVSVIPEALPVVTIFSFSHGAMRLARKKVVVKRLSAIEDLGSIEILCTDKTGTLTENKLKVVEIYSQKKDETLFFGNLAGYDFNIKRLEPFDVALWAALPDSLKASLKSAQKLEEIPFDPKRKRKSALIRYRNKKVLIVRGAHEYILDSCVNLNSTEKLKISSWIKAQGYAGRRVLTVAVKNLEKSYADLTLAEKNLDFLGIISFEDEIKQSAVSAIKKAGELGVRIKILTGDSPEVAGTVAHGVGLIKHPEDVITGDEFFAIPLEKQRQAVESFSVFARVSPEQKYHIINLLEISREVGYLGEGINDAPSLKAANVSLVVQSASDIARESADIILLQKSLDVIIDGIKEGREIFANTTKYIKSTLSSNFGNFYAVAIASLLIDYLPMLPLQLLLLNLLSDFPMIAISLDNVDDDEVKNPREHRIKDIILFSVAIGMVSTIFDFIYFSILYRISPQFLQSGWFIGSIITELLLIFSIRTKKWFWQAKRPALFLSWITFFAAVMTLIMVYSSFGQRVFSFVPLSGSLLILVFSIAVIYFLVTEIVKINYFRLSGSKTNKI